MTDRTNETVSPSGYPADTGRRLENDDTGTAERDPTSGEVMAVTHVYTRDELIAEREAILKAIARTEEDLRQRASLYTLSDDERAAWETVRDIDYLLGDCDE